MRRGRVSERSAHAVDRAIYTHVQFSKFTKFPHKHKILDCRIMYQLHACTCTCKLLTSSVLEYFNSSIVDLSNGLHLNIVAIATVKPLPIDVVFKILVSDILGEVVHVLELGGGGGGGKREKISHQFLC